MRGDLLMSCALEVDRRLDLARQLLDLANEHGMECGQDECLLLDGVVRDCAYKIQAAVQLWRREVEAGALSSKSQCFSSQGSEGPDGLERRPGISVSASRRVK
jgi:hypothetical protein